MTALFEKAVDAIRLLPSERQDEIGQMLLDWASAESEDYVLTPEQVEGVRRAIAELERDGPATKEEVRAVFGRHFG